VFESVAWWMWIVGFLLVLGPLVTLHELGHYIVGRWFGVKAEAFSVGFGGEIAGWTDKRGTRWKLSAIPLGGYVQFAGDMNPAGVTNPEWLALPPEEQAQTFQAKPLWQRALIVAAGPVTNLVIAIAILAAFNLLYGKPVEPADVLDFNEISDARDAGVELGDRITAIDGQEVTSFVEVPRFIAPYPGRTVRLSIERDGRLLEIPVKLRRRLESDRFGNESMIADLGIEFYLPSVGLFARDSPAKAAGMRVGDHISAIDGEKVDSFQDIIELVSPRPGETVQVTVKRSGVEQAIPVKLADVAGRGPDGREVRIGMLGLGPAFVTFTPVGPVEAVALGVKDSVEIMQTMIAGIGQIIVGDRSVKELGGPIKIAKFSGEQLSLGWQNFVSFVALISINLAFINLLPIPALDGGHLAFYAAEAVRRKPVGQRSQEWAFRTGVAFVLALMLFVTINDIASLPIFGR